MQIRYRASPKTMKIFNRNCILVSNYRIFFKPIQNPLDISIFFLREIFTERGNPGADLLMALRQVFLKLGTRTLERLLDAGQRLLAGSF